MISGEHSCEKKASSLPEEHQERLAKVLDDYLIKIEQGEPVSPEELLSEHEEDAVYLRQYLSGLKLFHAAAAPDTQNSAHETVVCQKPGQTIGDFRLIREVGRGGMGVVYEAEQLSLKRRVALKVLPYVAANNEKNLHRFRCESQTAASIDHPHIVPVYAIGEEHGVHFYAMQLIEGKSLTEYLGRQRHDDQFQRMTTIGAESIELPDELTSPQEGEPDSSSVLLDNRQMRDHITKLAELGAQAAKALQAAHEYGVVHRDVKPSNLLVDEHGKLWITDFGLARCREGSGLTQTGDILGTLRYMSPEQASGQGSLVDHRTDIFSLGMTLYEATSLRHPYDTDEKAIFTQDRYRFKSLRYWDRRIPADFETIIMKSLGEMPTDRYASAADLAADLNRFLADEPILARRPSLATRASKWARRHRKAVLSAASTLVFTVAALSVAVVMLFRMRAQDEVYSSQVQESLAEAQLAIDDNSNIEEQLEMIPGTEGIRYQLLDNNLKYYQKIAQNTTDDPKLATEAALAKSKIGKLKEASGEKSEALKYHRQAKAALEKIIANGDDDPEQLRSLAVCCSSIGLVLFDLGREEEALAACSEGLEIQQQLMEEGTSSSQLLIDISATYTNLGRVYQSRHAKTEAAKAFAQAVTVLEELNDDASESETILRQLAVGYSNLASIQEASDPNSAKQFYGRAIELQKSLGARFPYNLLYQSDLARSFNNLGYLHAKEQHWAGAQANYRAAIEGQKRLVDSAPAVARYRRDLAVSQNNLGMTLTHVERYEQAKVLFKEAGQVQRQLLAMKPGDLQARMSLGGILNNVGMLLEKQGDLVSAKMAYAQAVESQELAYAQAPRSSRVRELLSNHLFNFAKCCDHLGEPEEALKIALQRRALWQNSPQRLLRVAKQILAFGGQAEESNRGKIRLQEELNVAALETLRLALNAGLPFEQLQDRSLARLRSTQAYENLIAEFKDRNGHRASMQNQSWLGVN